VFFIVLVGGVLVLFLYIACVSPDDGGMRWGLSLVGGSAAFVVAFNVDSERASKVRDLMLGQSFSGIYTSPVL
jgi:hypothetical protein